MTAPETMLEDCQRLNDLAIAACVARDPAAAERAVLSLLVSLPEGEHIDPIRERAALVLSQLRGRSC